MAYRMQLKLYLISTYLINTTSAIGCINNNNNMVYTPVSGKIFPIKSVTHHQHCKQ